MPELPEVETVRRGLAPVMEGAIIDRVEQRRANLRFAFPDNFAARLAGRTFTGLGRRAKYLLADIDDGAVLVMHLGMTGSFRIEPGGNEDQSGRFALPKANDGKHDHVVFHLTGKAGGRVRIIYNDPRRFGFMALIARAQLSNHPWFCFLGIEPTGNALDGACLAQKFHHKKAPLKAALLDQKLIAGLGNIYVCESLWRTGLSPKRRAGTLVTKSGAPTERINQLAFHIRSVIDDAIVAGGSTLRDYRRADGSPGYFQHRFAAYGREGKPCEKNHCNGTIRRIIQSGRSTFYCGACQR